MTLTKPLGAILLVDDDPDDRFLTEEALRESKLVHTVVSVEDGEELMDYLYRRGKYSGDGSNCPKPAIILLDLNMPKKDGREALKEIKAHPLFRHIPIVILTTSKAEEDIFRSYELGVNSFITKPVSFDVLVDNMKTLIKYWFEIVDLPPAVTQDGTMDVAS